MQEVSKKLARQCALVINFQSFIFLLSGRGKSTLVSFLQTTASSCLTAVRETPQRMNEAEESSDTVETLFWDTSNEGRQNLVPEKCSHNLCGSYYLY